MFEFPISKLGPLEGIPEATIRVEWVDGRLRDRIFRGCRHIVIVSICVDSSGSYYLLISFLYNILDGQPVVTGGVRVRCPK